MVAKWRVNLRVDFESLISEAANLGVEVRLDSPAHDPEKPVILRVEGTIPGVMELAERWDIPPEDVLAFWN